MSANPLNPKTLRGITAKASSHADKVLPDHTPQEIKNLQQIAAGILVGVGFDIGTRANRTRKLTPDEKFELQSMFHSIGIGYSTEPKKKKKSIPDSLEVVHSRSITHQLCKECGRCKCDTGYRVVANLCRECKKKLP